MSSCYWLGRLVLGMKGQYPEYTPLPQYAHGDKGMEVDGKTATL